MTKDQIVEAMAESAHDAWWSAYKQLGYVPRLAAWGEEFMVPYSELSERGKEFDRIIMRAILDSFTHQNLEVVPKRQPMDDELVMAKLLSMWLSGKQLPSARQATVFESQRLADKYLRREKRLFKFTVEYYKPSGKFYTESEFECPAKDCGTEQPSAYMDDAVQYFLAQKPAPGLSGTGREYFARIDCEYGYPVLVKPRE